MKARSRRVRVRARPLLALTLVILLAGAAPATAIITGIAGSAITNDAFTQEEADTFGDWSVWQDNRNGNWEIYGYDRAAHTEFRITTESHNQVYPAVDWETVVWSDDRNGTWDIYGYDLIGDTEFSVATGAGNQRTPDVHERYIVWQSDTAGSWDIKAYDRYLHTTINVCSNVADQTDPAVWGDFVVWTDWRNGNLDIYGYDLTLRREFPIRIGTGHQEQPDICNEWIVYRDGSYGNYEIAAYNRATRTILRLTNDPSMQNNPRISGDWVVWHDTRDDPGDVYLFDLMDLELYDDLVPKTLNQYRPSISGARLTYELQSGDTEIAIADLSWTHDTESLAGSNRYATCKLICDAGIYPTDDVVLATGENFPDALGAAALAGALGAPIVLTDGDTLSPAAAASLADNCGHIYVVGGTSAVSDAVVAQAADAMLSCGGTTRIEGSNRYATSLEIADEVASLQGGSLTEKTCIVATGLNFPDALAASSIANACAIPIYLCDGVSMPASTLAMMDGDGVDRVIIVGGTAAVSSNVESALRARFGTANVVRIWGVNRFDTAAEVGGYAMAVCDFGATGAIIATGADFPDALSAGPLAGQRYAPILLTEPGTLPYATRGFLEMMSEDIHDITFVGGTSAISASVRSTVDGLLE